VPHIRKKCGGAHIRKTFGDKRRLYCNYFEYDDTTETAVTTARMVITETATILRTKVTEGERQCCNDER